AACAEAPKPAAVNATTAKAILLIVLSTAVAAGRAQMTAARNPNPHGYGTAPFSDKVYREF
ncbi:MAG TPA: hypothetical protein VEN78_18765, partial [Bradyrhizobium sp.]|nr:hypothetical protein [Bradyrhizobium sp.]